MALLPLRSLVPALGLFFLLATGCASTPDDVAPAAALATPLPLAMDRLATLAKGERLTYEVRVGPLHVADILYEVRPLVIENRPHLLIDGTTRMTGLAGVLSNAGGTTRVLVDATQFRPLTSVWSTSGKSVKTRAVSFSPDGQSAHAAVWTERYVDTASHKGASLFDPVSMVWLLRLVKPPGLNEEIRTLLVEGTALHLMTIRQEPSDDPAAYRLTLRSDKLDPKTGQFRGEPPKTLLFIDIERSSPGRILRMEGKIAFGSVVVVPARDEDSSASS